MSDVIIYHNPRCSKSRQALQLLRDRNCEPKIIDYLKTPLKLDELKQIVQQLNMTPRELLRSGEQTYKTLKLDNPGLSDDAVLQALMQHPILLQRPIVITQNRAIIGRPPEKVLELLE